MQPTEGRASALESEGVATPRVTQTKRKSLGGFRLFGVLVTARTESRTGTFPPICCVAAPAAPGGVGHDSAWQPAAIAGGAPPPANGGTLEGVRVGHRRALQAA